jgi:AraC-like DNA-binding protein
MNIVEACRFALESPDLLRARASAQHFDPHLHDTYSVVVLTKGSANLQSRRWNDAAHAGDVFLFNPFEVHAGEVQAGGNPRQLAEYDVLYPSVRFVSDCPAAAQGRSSYPVLRTSVLRRSETTQALIEALLATTTVGAAVENALRHVLQACAFESAGSASYGITAVRAACEVIHARFTNPLGTHELARHARLHESHFIRVFHRVTGLAPQGYIRQLRIARARELICAGAELIDVAQAAGFCDQAHLTREFKKAYGVTPGRLSRDLHRPRC